MSRVVSDHNIQTYPNSILSLQTIKTLETYPPDSTDYIPISSLASADKLEVQEPKLM